LYQLLNISTGLNPEGSEVFATQLVALGHCPERQLYVFQTDPDKVARLVGLVSSVRLVFSAAAIRSLA
jgi:hypothetical protein